MTATLEKVRAMMAEAKTIKRLNQVFEFYRPKFKSNTIKIRLAVLRDNRSAEITEELEYLRAVTDKDRVINLATPKGMAGSWREIEACSGWRPPKCPV